jgi:hypothetical protein
MIGMERNVLSIRAALEKGYEPRLYSYDAGRIPLGEIDAVLDFKIWSKRIIAINAYFTKKGTGDKFVVTIYCNHKTGRYSLPGSTVDFGGCPVACLYRLRVEVNGGRGKVRVLLTKVEQKDLTSVGK